MDTKPLRPEYGPPPACMPSVRAKISGYDYTYRVSTGRHVENPLCGMVNETAGSAAFEPDVVRYLPPPGQREPQREAQDVVAAVEGAVLRIPQALVMSPSWWRTQCRFRGLLVGGSRQVLQSRIRNHGVNAGMSPGMEDACYKMRRAYLKSVEKPWSQMSNDDKAQQWPRRLIYEELIFPTVESCGSLTGTARTNSDRTIAAFVKDSGDEIERILGSRKRNGKGEVRLHLPMLGLRDGGSSC